MHEVIRWILHAGPHLEQQALTVALGERLQAHAPVDRIFTVVMALHPVTHGVGVAWRADGSTECTTVGWDVRELDSHRESPVSYVMEHRTEYRARLDGKPQEYGLLRRFEAEGLTDWLGLHVNLGPWDSVLAFSSAAPGGFEDHQLAFLRQVRDALAPVLQVHALRRTASAILDTYLGRHAGQRVWQGKIKHGDGDDIHAVIWFCDLRSSTPLADRLPRPEFMALLDRFFGAMAGAIHDGGGEVLRYIGDAVLAIFPIQDPAVPGPSVRAAVAAARDACDRMATLNGGRAEAGEEPLEFGIGLHLGDVMYGNIGTPTRLEFSVIGAAANEAARVESMCKELDRAVLLSQAVAAHLPGETEPLGQFELRGVSRPMALHGLT